MNVTSKPPNPKVESKSPADKTPNLTAQHFAIGDKITTKSGKSGVVTHVHGKAGYLFIHNKEQGKTYHVSCGSVTSIDGQNEGDGLGEDLKAAADKMVEGPAATALKSHGWKPVKETEGAVTYAHPKMGGQFHVLADRTLLNNESGSAIEPGKAAEYLRGFHSNGTKRVEGAAKQKAAEGYTPEGKPTAGVPKGVSMNWKDYGKGDVVVSHDGEDWTVDHAVGPGVYATSKEGDGAKTLIKWNEIAKHTPKKEGPGSVSWQREPDGAGPSRARRSRGRDAPCTSTTSRSRELDKPLDRRRRPVPQWAPLPTAGARHSARCAIKEGCSWTPTGLHNCH